MIVKTLPVHTYKQMSLLAHQYGWHPITTVESPDYVWTSMVDDFCGSGTVEWRKERYSQLMSVLSTGVDVRDWFMANTQIVPYLMATTLKVARTTGRSTHCEAVILCILARAYCYTSSEADRTRIQRDARNDAMSNQSIEVARESVAERTTAASVHYRFCVPFEESRYQQQQIGILASILETDTDATHTSSIRDTDYVKLLARISSGGACGGAGGDKIALMLMAKQQQINMATRNADQEH